MNSISYNPFNSNVDLVIASNNISFYKGTSVIRYGKRDKKNLNGFSFGIIALERDATLFVLKHEYGHIKQQRLLGIGLYTTMVAVPSLISFYTSDSSDAHMNRWYEEWATEWGSRGGLWW